jgi:hypothetical protein
MIRVLDIYSRRVNGSSYTELAAKIKIGPRTRAYRCGQFLSGLCDSYISEIDLENKTVTIQFNTGNKKYEITNAKC